jgi:hypothetical protein
MSDLKTVNLVPLQAVIGRVLTLLPKDSISADLLEEWAYESYESIAPVDVYENETAFVKVVNNRAVPPQGATNILMILYDQDSIDPDSKRYVEKTNTTTEVKTEKEILEGNTTHTTIETTITTKDPVKLKNQPGIPVYNSKDPDYNVVNQQLYRFIKPGYRQNWRPLPISTNVFHSSILLGAPPEFYKNCGHTFSIQKGCILTTFCEGTLAIAYKSLPKNEDGEFLIPDFEYVKKALETYMLKRYWQWKLNLREDGAYSMYRMYSQEYELLATKATGELMMPSLIDYQNLRNMNKFIKEDSPFSVALGALNSQELLNFNNERDSYHNYLPYFWNFSIRKYY